MVPGQMRTITTLTVTREGLVPSYGQWVSPGFWMLVHVRQLMQFLQLQLDLINAIR